MNEGGNTGIDLRVLGPIELCIEGRVVPLGGRNPMALLAYLARHRERVVSAAELVTAIWGVDVSDRARLHVLLSKLRIQLRGQGVDAASVVSTVNGGYRLTLPESACDLGRFESARARAHIAARAADHAEAARLYRDALIEWRGRPFGGLEPIASDWDNSTSDTKATAENSDGRPLAFVDDMGTVLDEQRWQCLEARIDADLACGMATELIAELTALTREKKFNEAFWAQLITAQYLGHRHADALASLREIRRLLDEELGTTPGHRLTELEGRIHRQESLEPLRGPAPRRAAATTVARDPQPLSGRLRLADGRVVPVGSSAVTIGRMDDNDVILDDSEVSRYHARISRSAVGLVIRDLDSTNGVAVNGELIDVTTVLGDNDTIHIGATTMVFQRT